MTCPLCRAKLEKKIVPAAKRRVIERCCRCAFSLSHRDHDAKN